MPTRAPDLIIEILKRAARRVENGPTSRLVRIGESDEHMEGREAERRSQAAWRDTWVSVDLEVVIAYLEGYCSVADIQSGRRTVMDIDQVLK